MDIVIGIIVGLLVLMVLVVAHEFGHFLAARRNGVKVLEFGIGFPPRAIAWKKDPTTHKWRKLKRSEWEKEKITKVVMDEKTNDGMIFSLNWLPIGGFCQMDGESAEDKRPGTFGNASFWSKTKILFAGVAANWLVAWILLTILAWTGMPQFLEGQFTIEADTRSSGGTVMVAGVKEGSPAEAAGFQTGDYIARINGREVNNGSDVTAINKEYPGEQVTYTILRPGAPECNCDENLELVATLNGSDAEYLLGVSMESSQSYNYSTWSAPIVGAGVTLQMTGETFRGLGELIWNLISGAGRMLSFDGEVRESGQAAISAAGESVAGPIGIIGVIFPRYTAAGPSNLLFLAALISVSLACMNVLPIPALDGGRWLLFAIYKIRRKTLTKATEQKIVSRAMVALLAIMAVVAVLDVVRLFHEK